jgi:carboxymethylenebutenolidase
MYEFEKIRSTPPLYAYIKKAENHGQEPFPCIIVFMHRPGVDKSQQKVVEDLAEAGYVGVCHDSYREGLLKDSYTDQTIFEDFETTLRFVKNLDYVNEEKIGVLGFCMGGRHVYLAGARYSELKAVVSYYGFPGQGSDANSTPMKVVNSMSMPVTGIFGRQDHLFPYEDVEKFKKLLLNHSEKNQILVYDDVGHGFLNPYSERHKDGVSAEKAWKKTIEFYDKYVK